LGLALRACDEAPLTQPLRRGFALVHAAAADEELDIDGLGSRPRPRRPLAQRLLNTPRVVTARAEHDDTTGRLPLSRQRPGLAGERLGKLLALDGGAQREPLLCLEPLLHDLVAPIRISQPEHLFTAPLAARRGQREEPQPWNDFSLGWSRWTQRPSVGIDTARELLDQPFERLNEVCLVERDQRVCPEEPRVVGPHLARDTVTREQQP